MPERTLLDHLRAAGIDPRRDLDNVLWALYPSDGVERRQAIVLLGRFDAASAARYLTGPLKASPATASGHTAYEVTLPDPTTCEPSRTWTVSVDPRWIVLSDPASHADVVARLSGEPPDRGNDLAWWRPLARGDVLSLGVWDVGQLSAAASHPLVSASAASIATDADAVRHVYLGLGVRPVPPHGRLRLVVDAQDASRVSRKIETLRQAVDASRGRWMETMPTVAALYRSLRVETEASRSTIELTVDRSLAKNVQQLASEVGGAILGGLGVQATAGTRTPPEERIDPSPTVFEPSLDAATLGAYDPRAMFAEEVDQTKGPFGLRVGAIRLGSEPAVGLELDVEAFAGAIPNLAGGSERMRLFVDSVRSASGRELLRAEECGKERNALAVSFTTTGSDRWKATKTVRLVPDADAASVQTVSGHVELGLPVRTKAVTVAHPGRGTVVRESGAAFTVTDARAGTVAYQMTGATDRVLDFQALNAAGKPLASTSAYWTSFLFGDGVAGQKDFAGTVDRLEVVFAAETKKLDFPFTLTDVSLAGKPGPVFADGTPPLRPYGYAEMVKDTGAPHWRRLPARDAKEAYRSVAFLEPFELYFDRAQAFYMLKLDFALRSPDLPDFQRTFSLGRMRVTRLELGDGTVVEPPPPADDAGRASAFRPSWDTEVSFPSAPKDGVLSTPLWLIVDSKAKPEELKAVQGTLTLRFPRTLETIHLDDLAVGRTGQAGAMTVTVAGRGRRSVALQASRDGDRVVYVQLLNAEGQPVAFSGPQTTVRDDGSWRFELSPMSACASATVVIASETDTREYPFVLSAR